MKEDSERIEKLKDELFSARCLIINLMPTDLRTILNSYSMSKLIVHPQDWLLSTSEEIAMSTRAMEEHSNTYNARASCPLCGDGTNSPSESGFALPTGLQRHLEGYGNMARCGVMDAAYEVAKTWFLHRLKAKSMIEAFEKLRELEERKKTEPLFRTGPRTSELAADDIWRPRDLNQQIWAEERLRNLKFRKNVEENCTSFTRHFKDWVVYADPRQLGAISFFVYSSTQPEQRPDKPLRRFQLRDDWKHNLEEKLLTAIRTHDT